MGQSSVKLSPGLQKKAFDFGVSRDSTKVRSGRHYSLTNVERSWLFNIRVGTMVYLRHLFVDIQPYVPSHFFHAVGLLPRRCWSAFEEGEAFWRSAGREKCMGLL